MSEGYFIRRDALMKAFGGDERSARSFEVMQQQVADTSGAATEAKATTERMVDASFLTLGGNTELTGERVFVPGYGLKATEDGGQYTLESTGPNVDGGHRVEFAVTGPTTLALPVHGTVATREWVKVNPGGGSLVNAADDTAAASAGVAVGGFYHNAGALRVRLA